MWQWLGSWAWTALVATALFSYVVVNCRKGSGGSKQATQKTKSIRKEPKKAAGGAHERPSGASHKKVKRGPEPPVEAPPAAAPAPIDDATKTLAKTGAMPGKTEQPLEEDPDLRTRSNYDIDTKDAPQPTAEDGKVASAFQK